MIDWKTLKFYKDDDLATELKIIETAYLCEGALRMLKGVEGVYFLILNGLICYVGKSNNIANRLLDHKRKGREFEMVGYVCDESNPLTLLEHQYIRRFMPAWNKSGKTNAERGITSRYHATPHMEHVTVLTA